MKFNSTIIGVGILAGLASALMSSGVIAQSGIAMVLYFLTPLPIFMAALGWGSSAGIVAALAATVTVGVVTAPMAALLIALTSFIPAAVGAYLSGLARPASDMGGSKDILVWYPLSDIIFRLALMVAVSFIIIGYMIGFGEDMVRELTTQVMERIKEAEPTYHSDENMQNAMASILMVVLPAMQPAIALAALIGNLYLALRLTGASGRLKRPRDDWPTTLRMPIAALSVVAVALALSFFGAGISQVALVFVGSVGTGFLFSGFAIMHQRTRGMNLRPLILWLSYIGITVLSPLLIIFFVIGLFDTTRTAPVSKNQKSDQS
ncbi:DUF2232 domain-containing protein [Brucellaceae bacterium C25G]